MRASHKILYTLSHFNICRQQQQQQHCFGDPTTFLWGAPQQLSPDNAPLPFSGAQHVQPFSVSWPDQNQHKHIKPNSHHHTNTGWSRTNTTDDDIVCEQPTMYTTTTTLPPPSSKWNATQMMGLQTRVKDDIETGRKHKFSVADTTTTTTTTAAKKRRSCCSSNAMEVLIGAVLLVTIIMIVTAVCVTNMLTSSSATLQVSTISATTTVGGGTPYNVASVFVDNNGDDDDDDFSEQRQQQQSMKTSIREELTKTYTLSETTQEEYTHLQRIPSRGYLKDVLPKDIININAICTVNTMDDNDSTTKKKLHKFVMEWIDDGEDPPQRSENDQWTPWFMMRTDESNGRGRDGGAYFLVFSKPMNGSLYAARCVCTFEIEQYQTSPK